MEGKFDFGPHGNSALQASRYGGSRVWDARGFDQQIGRQQQIHGVPALLVGNAFVVQLGRVRSLQRAAVAQKHAVAAVFGQDGCAHAAFAAAQNGNRGILVQQVHGINAV